ncbi:MAG: hypothetical protein AB7E49_08550 [Campylobacterales bacterium]
MSFPLDPKVKKCVLQAVETFLDTGIHQDVIVEYSVKKDGGHTAKFVVVENGCQWFLENDFLENGLKSYVKTGRTGSVKHGYVLFETCRLGDGLFVIGNDLENIEADLARKTG